jgi:DNA-binding transcriptional LysR family regulator
MLNVERLRVLREVVRAGSISGAARALAYTPSAVSQQLAKLEREIGAALPTSSAG